MKITVQNGARHGLSRRELEAIIHALPPALNRVAKSLTLYASAESAINVTYYAKESVIGLHWPLDNSLTPTKSQAVSELLIALSIIAERGDLPKRVTDSVRLRHVEAVSDLQQQCEKLLHQTSL